MEAGREVRSCGGAGAQSVSGEDSQLLEAWQELPKESQQKILEVLRSGP